MTVLPAVPTSMASSNILSSGALERAQARVARILQLLSRMESVSYPAQPQTTIHKPCEPLELLSHRQCSVVNDAGRRPPITVSTGRYEKKADNVPERAHRLHESLSNSRYVTKSMKGGTTISGSHPLREHEEQNAPRRFLRTRFNEPVKTFWESSQPTKPPAFLNSQFREEWQGCQDLLKRCREIQTIPCEIRFRRRLLRNGSTWGTKHTQGLEALSGPKAYMPFHRSIPPMPEPRSPVLRSCLKPPKVYHYKRGPDRCQPQAKKQVTFSDMEQVRWFYKSCPASGYLPRTRESEVRSHSQGNRARQALQTCSDKTSSGLSGWPRPTWHV